MGNGLDVGERPSAVRKERAFANGSAKGSNRPVADLQNGPCEGAVSARKRSFRVRQYRPFSDALRDAGKALTAVKNLDDSRRKLRRAGAAAPRICNVVSSPACCLRRSPSCPLLGIGIANEGTRSASPRR